MTLKNEMIRAIGKQLEKIKRLKKQGQHELAAHLMKQLKKNYGFWLKEAAA